MFSVQEALFQLGTIYEKRGANDPAQLEQAAKTFELLLNKVPGDPNLCSRLGTYVRGDRSDYFEELHRAVYASIESSIFVKSYS